MKKSKTFLSDDILFVLEELLVVALIALSALLILPSAFSDNDMHVSQNDVLNVPVVVIDAGHGGIDGGASAGEVYEKDLNLKISGKVRDYLSLYSVNAVMTRERDTLLADDESKHKKRDDLLARVKFANSFGDCIYVSIHMNKFPIEKYSGLQVFYSPNNPLSEALSLVIQENVREKIDPDNTRQTKKAGASIYVLDRLTCPAVLIECGFLSNAEELKKLTDDGYQNALAFVIAGSIIEYLNL